MSAHSKANQYVCPTDRQLALRAKVRCGWSAARSTPPLSAPEREAIAAVVRRAERLDEQEARRVGRLVARLETMRRPPAPGQAQGGAAAGRECALCGEPARLLAPLRACAACRLPACRRCVAEAPPGGARAHVCALCAEARETWKKSGAWFYRALPAYVLPERRAAPPAPAAAQGGGGGGAGDAAGSDESECGSPRTRRRYSRRDSRQSAGAPHEGGVLSRGVSALSLSRQRSDSSGGPPPAAAPPPLQRSASRSSTASTRARRDPAPAPAPAPSPASPADAGFGTLELRVAYEPAASALAVTVLRARALRPMDMAGLADPFCRLHLAPREGEAADGAGGEAGGGARTRTVHKTRNPEFNETVQFFGVTESDLAAKSLEVVVLDDDRYGCDEMGRACVSLRECARAGGCGGEGGAVRLSLGGAGVGAGAGAAGGARLLVALCYSTRRRALAVTVRRAAGLPARDANGSSDPYVRLELCAEAGAGAGRGPGLGLGRGRARRTAVRRRTLSPVWDEEFLFETRPTELALQALALTVWDRDYGKRDDFLGALSLGAASKGRRLKHWLDCIRFPDHRHEQWHALADDPAP